jgi:hypothetical protein
VFFATGEGEPKAIGEAVFLSELELSVNELNAGVEAECDPNKLVAGGPNGFEAVDDEEPKENGSFVGWKEDAEELKMLDISEDVDVLSVFRGFGIPNAVEDGAIVEKAVAVLEGFDRLPNMEPDVGGPNILVEVVAVSVEPEDTVVVGGPKKLLEGLEPEPKTELFKSGVEDEVDIDFVPKPPKGEAAGGSEANDLIFSPSEESSYSFCICDRCDLYDSKTLVKSENGSLSAEVLIEFKSDTLSARRLI